MDLTVPADCGNAPRMGIVADVVSAWARGDHAALAEALAEDATWTIVGDRAHEGRDDAATVRPPVDPEAVEIASIITHGRLASCDGHLVTVGRRIDFSHVLRFAGAGKTAKIVEIRTYSIEE